eukprot:1512599-Rhodomonas_salina.1
MNSSAPVTPVDKLHEENNGASSEEGEGVKLSLRPSTHGQRGRERGKEGQREWEEGGGGS